MIMGNTIDIPKPYPKLATLKKKEEIKNRRTAIKMATTTILCDLLNKFSNFSIGLGIIY